MTGSAPTAAEAKLIFWVGADPDDLERVRPLLLCMGNKIVHTGGHGTGTSVKMVVNVLMGNAMAAFAEGMALAKGSERTRPARDTRAPPTLRQRYATVRRWALAGWEESSRFRGPTPMNPAASVTRCPISATRATDAAQRPGARVARMTAWRSVTGDQSRLVT